MAAFKISWEETMLAYFWFKNRNNSMTFCFNSSVWNCFILSMFSSLPKVDSWTNLISSASFWKISARTWTTRSVWPMITSLLASYNCMIHFKIGPFSSGAACNGKWLNNAGKTCSTGIAAGFFNAISATHPQAFALDSLTTSSDSSSSTFACSSDLLNKWNNICKICW
ncbi:hypothetical protein EJF18_30849 [Clavispora lusitaniae]|uniref:Uncharacterized protein n=1 Tax=Clavispora lusitaniae TaxID=36911 RepID=A0ACD0WJZ2_CLALS|nr:hypothetical protein EJF14_30849 [Clavispora lusitaniae]QFZ32835.1 hypothetical protein EJF16_30849 [Clavispora lusitaniae]QFZ38505.1 hypothetical protein EJF15_30849 [Clavispora lusitaniae]QFZ44187.1 hypothetical protein EJF18_30849 [Clavispora lusitaniae]QFZ49865.1 hypothetical protein EJF17_30849 [Clavispora lusitaniae]